jgi:hypothetical protein
MVCDKVTRLHPSSAQWGAHLSSIKDEIVELAVWKDHHQPKRPGQVGFREDLTWKRCGPAPESIDVGGDDRRPPMSLARPARARVLSGACRTGASIANGGTPFGEQISKSYSAAEAPVPALAFAVAGPGSPGRAARGLPGGRRRFSGQRKFRGQMGRLVASTPCRPDGTEIRRALLLCHRPRQRRV